jgi:hypothetical protein
MQKHRTTLVFFGVKHFLCLKFCLNQGNLMAAHFIEMIKERNIDTDNQYGP